MYIKLNKYINIQSVLSGVTLLIVMISTSNTYAQNKSHINIGLMYPISSNGINASRDTNDFSLNLIAGLSAAERGFTIAGISNIVGHDAAGFQLTGLSNHIGGQSNGLMVAGLLNSYRGGSGLSIAGLTNIARNNTGAQIAGVLNKGGNIAALQLGGFMNIAGDLKGTQVAGVINIAKRSKGLQVGFINVADSAGTQIGVVNIAKNSEKSLGLSIDETQTSILSYRSGGRVFYGIIGAGYNFNNKNQKYAYQAGIGARLINAGMFRLKSELIASGLESFKGSGYLKVSSYLMPALRLGKSVEIFAGPSFNSVETNTEEGKNLIKNYISGWSSTNGPDFHGYYFGYTAGIQVHL